LHQKRKDIKLRNTSNRYSRWSLYLSAFPQEENQVIWMLLLVAPPPQLVLCLSTCLYSCTLPSESHSPSFSYVFSIYQGLFLLLIHSLTSQLVNLIHLSSISPVHTINLQVICLHMHLLHTGFDQDVCFLKA